MERIASYLGGSTVSSSTERARKRMDRAEKLKTSKQIDNYMEILYDAGLKKDREKHTKIQIRL